jgi:hypothetical protein
MKRAPGTPAHVLFLATTQDYGDLIYINLEVDQSAKEDNTLLMSDWLNGTIRQMSESNVSFELQTSEILMNKMGNNPLGVLVAGSEVVDGKKREIAKVLVPMTNRYRDDSAIHVAVSYPIDCPQSLKDDLYKILRSVDIHTDHNR